MSMSSSSLIQKVPDDVLRELTGFLSDGDHLRLALTAKSVYAAIPPRPTAVKLDTFPKVLSLHNTLCGSSCTPPEALRDIDIHLPTPKDVKAAVSLLRDIFSQARNLCRLSLGAAEYADLEVRRCLEHLSSLAHLVVHEGKCRSPTTTSTSLPRSVQSFHLRSSANGTTWSSLVRSLSNLPKLVTLTLEQCALEEADAEFDDEDEPDEDEDGDEDGDGEDEDEDDASEDGQDEDGQDEEDEDGQDEEDEDGEYEEDEDGGNTQDAEQRTPQSSLPNLHTLHILSTALPESYAVFADLFPKVDTLTLDDGILPFEDEDDIDLEGRSLRQVTVSAIDIPSSPLPWNVHNLTLWTPTYDHNELVDEIYVCYPEALSGLTLRLPELGAEMWTAVVENTSTLRRLELETYEEDMVSLLTMLADIFDEEAGLEYDTETLPVSMLSIAARGRHGEEQSEAALARFLSCAPTALPNLRYVAVAAPPKISKNVFDDLAGERAPWRWWRVIRGEGDVAAAKEIPAWEGERVRQYFRKADRAQADSFDEHFHALR
ncbi:hypothetical protein FKP32DRAFT_1760593 [Trametes sanguinea]|nr:hypothetical protein FKP32DRAFT_1760593 [Trametes sanguinea]